MTVRAFGSRDLGASPLGHRSRPEARPDVRPEVPPDVRADMRADMRADVPSEMWADVRPGIGETAAHVGRQAIVVVAAVLGYFAVRGLTDANPATALRNAGRVMATERLLHLDFEVPLQRLVVGHQSLTQALNWIYIFGHWPVIAATLLWLAILHRETFVRARNAMLISGAVGLLVFAAFPVAPPRLADGRLVDTVTVQSNAYRVLQPPAFTNQYAAMPSLHVGWNLLMTLAILAAARATWLRVLAVALTLSMDATVVLTANHYVVDGVAGAALTVAAWHLAGLLPSGPAPKRERLAGDVAAAGGGLPLEPGQEVLAPDVVRKARRWRVGRRGRRTASPRVVDVDGDRVPPVAGSYRPSSSSSPEIGLPASSWHHTGDWRAVSRWSGRGRRRVRPRPRARCTGPPPPA